MKDIRMTSKNTFVKSLNKVKIKVLQSTGLGGETGWNAIELEKRKRKAY